MFGKNTFAKNLSTCTVDWGHCRLGFDATQ